MCVWVEFVIDWEYLKEDFIIILEFIFLYWFKFNGLNLYWFKLVRI